jgi:membrane protease YdiL (CAAX protease family)
MLGYAEDARRPLASLVFLLPLILAYELGLILVDPSPIGQQDRVIAYHLMQMFFRMFGATGIFLPGILIIAILLSSHLLSRQPWTVRGATLVGMLGESLLWTMPLFLLNRTIRYAAGSGGRSDWLESVVISTGAGVYEELVFRLVLVTALVILLEDMLKLQKMHALVVAVLLAAILFAAHHHQPLGVEPYDAARFLFRTVAGLYLGALFLLRGYGITAGCHALYNVIVVTLYAIPE